jgi:hypothetical protein
MGTSFSDGGSRISLARYKCLGWGHSRATCSSLIHCKYCFNYGHISRNCFARRRKKSNRPKSPALPVLSSASVGKVPSGAKQVGFKSASLGDHISSSSSPPPLSPATAEVHAAALAAMANYPVDPWSLTALLSVIARRRRILPSRCSRSSAPLFVASTKMWPSSSLTRQLIRWTTLMSPMPSMVFW